MIIKKLWEEIDDALILTIITFISIPFMIPFAIFGINLTTLIIGFIILEVLYHIEPRTKEEMKKGRTFLSVIYNKFDKAFDTFVILSLGTLLYHLGKYIINNWQQVQKVLAVIAIVIIWFGLNWLRDIKLRKKLKIKTERRLK